MITGRAPANCARSAVMQNVPVKMHGLAQIEAFS